MTYLLFVISLLFHFFLFLLHDLVSVFGFSSVLISISIYFLSFASLVLLFFQAKIERLLKNYFRFLNFFGTWFWFMLLFFLFLPLFFGGGESSSLFITIIFFSSMSFFFPWYLLKNFVRYCLSCLYFMSHLIFC